jgi:RimJ/RimL family protein N-acetyltransferase
MARMTDTHAFIAHLRRHLLQSGQAGLPHFAVMTEVDGPWLETELGTRWSSHVTTPGWGRTWLLWEGPQSSEGRVVGHVDLRGPRVWTAIHRAELSIGLERHVIGVGWGTALLSETIRWAASEGHLRWIDLRVFEANAPARKLYRKLGFIENGRVEDAFRMHDGTTIHDYGMVLDLDAVRARR